MRNLSSVRNHHYKKKPTATTDKENMNKTATYNTKHAVHEVKNQKPLASRKLNSHVQYNNEDKMKPDVTTNECFSIDKLGDVLKPDVTTNEDFSFEKLRGAVKNFQKQQQDHLTRYELANSNVKYKSKFTHNDVKESNDAKQSDQGCQMPLVRDVTESKKDSVGKQSIKNVSDMEAGRYELDPKGMSSTNVDTMGNSKLAARNKVVRSFTSPGNRSTPKPVKRSFTRVCDQNDRINNHPAQKFSSLHICTNSIQARRKSNRNSSAFPPMPEADRITADGDVISIDSDSSPRNMPNMCDGDIGCPNIGNQSQTISPNSSRDDAQPRQKYQRPNDSGNDNYSTTPQNLNRSEMVNVSTTSKKGAFPPFRKDTQSNLNDSRLTNRSSHAKSRSNRSVYAHTPKIKKEEVEATDNKNASVQKISQWLGNDPFGNKKQVIIRQGAMIMTRAILFEDEDVVQMRKKETLSVRERQHFPTGKVSEGKKWLQGAFVAGKDDNDHSSVLKRRNNVESTLKQVCNERQ